MILAFNPRRTMIEAVDADSSGYGRLTVSMLDTERPVPLLRYQTGDVVRMLDSARSRSPAGTAGVTLPGPLPETMLALRGRDKDGLPDGSHVGATRTRSTRIPLVADRADRCLPADCDGGRPRAHVQLVQAREADAAFEGRVRAALGIAAA